MSRRATVAASIILAWVAGLGVLVRREYFRPPLARLAEAALRVSPGALYYAVLQGNRQVGFASSTIDTASAAITLSDYLVADLPVGGQLRRATARTNVSLSRALRVRNFELAVEADGPPLRASGEVRGDSLLVLAITAGGTRADTQRVPLAGPVLLPPLVPLAVALGERPRVGKHYVLPVFDAATMRPKDVGLEIRAESLFVVNDSAVFDPATARWHGVLPDTIRAWQLATDSPSTTSGYNGWIDEQGRVVETTQMGFVLRRMPYEVAFENWRLDSASRGAHAAAQDIIETSAIASNKKLKTRLTELRVRLSGVGLRGFDLNGGRQVFRGDTLIVRREARSALMFPPGYEMPSGPIEYTRPEILIESDAPEIISLAQRIAGGERRPWIAAIRLNYWVYDSLKKRVTFGVPSALQVLHTRSGDCNEHTQLFVALARALHISARVASGLMYVDGKFYYHAWPEVYLQDWVAVDPTFGQFPADASHLRFVVGGLNRQTELLRLMDNLKIDVLNAR